MSTEQTKDKVNTANGIQEQDQSNSAMEKDIVETNDYNPDHYSEIDANDHFGNVDTLVDDANIEISMTKCLHLHQVKDSIL